MPGDPRLTFFTLLVLAFLVGGLLLYSRGKSIQSSNLPVDRADLVLRGVMAAGHVYFLVCIPLWLWCSWAMGCYTVPDSEGSRQTVPVYLPYQVMDVAVATPSSKGDATQLLEVPAPPPDPYKAPGATWMWKVTTPRVTEGEWVWVMDHGPRLSPPVRCTSPAARSA